MKFFKVVKSKEYFIKKRASEINWNTITEGRDSDGLIYKLSLNKNGTINAKHGDMLDMDYPKEDVLALVDIYDKNGKLINKAMD